MPCSCQAQATESEHLARLKRYSNLGALARLTFETLKPSGTSADPESQRHFREAAQAAEEYAIEPRGWLVLTGSVGAGKTHLAAGIANKCLEHGHPALYISVPDLLDHLRAAFAPTSEVTYDQLFEQVRNAPVLILDDMGAHATTPWAEEKLYQVLNHRFNLQLPTVIVVSGTFNQLDEQLQARLKDPQLVVTIHVGSPTSSSHWRLDRVKNELMKRMTWETFDTRGNYADPPGQESLKQALSSAKVFSAAPSGWFVLTGVPGCGKTHLAMAIINERLRLGEAALFAFVPDLLDYLRLTFSPQSRVTYDQLFEEVRTASLLVLDDLGAQSSTPWAEEKLYQILVYRYEMMLPTVITIRGYIEDLPEAVRSRLMDQRLVELTPIGAPDYRSRGKRPNLRGRNYRQSRTN